MKIPTNVVRPLGVSLMGGRVSLLYLSKQRSHAKLSQAITEDGENFAESPHAPALLSLGQRADTLENANNLQFSQVMQQRFLSSTRNSRLSIAQCEVSDFDIEIWHPLQARLPLARSGVIVSEYKSNGRFTLVFAGPKGIGVAFSQGLGAWHTPAQPLLSPRSEHFDRANLDVISAQLIDEGILVTYQALTTRKSKQYLGIGAALLDRSNPACVLWRSIHPLYERNVSRAAHISAIGAVALHGELFLYIAGRTTGLELTRISLEIIGSETHHEAPVMKRHVHNPLIAPVGGQPWEAVGTFNPGVAYDGDRTHLFYRAMGLDGISRVGYSVSDDGIHFTRLKAPVLDYGAGFSAMAGKQLSFQPEQYGSGGGWGGIEDPRAVIIDKTLYLSFGIFENWQSMRLALATLPLDALNAKDWVWSSPLIISPENETHKNWVLFPEKISGKFAVLHAMTPTIQITYVDNLEKLAGHPIQSNNQRSGREGEWDGFVRGAAAPPLKTRWGWLLFYHGMDPKQPDIGYKVGAMLLDHNDPTTVLYRSKRPLLVPREWYENEWKPGVVYASGAVIDGNRLSIYYGGGDRHICVANAQLDEFIEELKNDQPLQLQTAEVS